MLAGIWLQRDITLLGVKTTADLSVYPEKCAACVLHLYTSFFKCWVFFQLKSLLVMRGIDFTV